MFGNIVRARIAYTFVILSVCTSGIALDKRVLNPSLHEDNRTQQYGCVFIVGVIFGKIIKQITSCPNGGYILHGDNASRALRMI